MKKIRDFVRGERFRELFVYGVAGALTTAVNYAVYFAVTRLVAAAAGLPQDDVGLITLGNVSAWLVAVVFAFVVNKIFVFKSASWEKSVLLHEIWTFTAARLFSLGFDAAFMAAAVTFMGMNDLVAKLISQAVVIIMNYALSKIWVFRKK